MTATNRFTRLRENGQYEVLAEDHCIAIREERIEHGTPLHYNFVTHLHYISGEIIDRLAAYENIGSLEEYERMTRQAERYEQEQKKLHKMAERKVVELQKERNKLHAAMDEIKKISGTLDYNGYV